VSVADQKKLKVDPEEVEVSTFFFETLSFEPIEIELNNFTKGSEIVVKSKKKVLKVFDYVGRDDYFGVMMDKYCGKLGQVIIVDTILPQE